MTKSGSFGIAEINENTQEIIAFLAIYDLEIKFEKKLINFLRKIVNKSLSKSKM